MNKPGRTFAIVALGLAMLALTAGAFGLAGVHAAGLGGGKLPLIHFGVGTATATPPPTFTPTPGAGPAASIELMPDPDEIVCDGVHSSRITVHVRDALGASVNNGTPVYFSVTGRPGVADPSVATIQNGVVTTKVHGFLLPQNAFQPFFVQVDVGRIEASIRVLCLPPAQCPPGVPCTPCDPTSPPQPASPPCAPPCAPASPPQAFSPPCAPPCDPSSPPQAFSPPCAPPCGPASPPQAFSPPCATPTPPLEPLCVPVSPSSPPCDTPTPTLTPPCGPSSPPFGYPACATPTPLPGCSPFVPASPPCVPATPLPCLPGVISPQCGPDNGYSIALDCDTAAAGIQASCNVPLGATSLDVAVVLRNAGPRTDVPAAFNFIVHDSDTSRLNPPPGTDANFNANPDFNEAGLGTSWTCAVAPPSANTGADGPGKATSFLLCFDASGLSAPVPPGTERRLATVHYDLPPGAAAGPVPLSLSDVVFANYLEEQLLLCDSSSTPPSQCFGATVNLVAGPAGGPKPPTATPTPAPPPCADVTRDGRVTLDDVLAMVMRLRQRHPSLRYDVNHDGKVDTADLLMVVQQLGRRCGPTRPPDR
jgi:hypothetical protein